MIHERRNVRAGGDPEPGFDHAAEHDAEAERARSRNHAHRFADPTRLRQLDVDPVCALRAGCDVGERVAVLVDVDRDGRATLQLRPAWIAGGERLLAVLEVELRQVLERLVERPRFVDVALERQVGHAHELRERGRRRARRVRRASASAA